MQKATESYRTYSIPGKTTALVPEFAEKDLSSAELQPRFLRLQLRIYPCQNTLMMMRMMLLLMMMMMMMMMMMILKLLYMKDQVEDDVKRHFPFFSGEHFKV